MTVTEEICDIVGYERLAEICEKLGGAEWKIPTGPPKRERDKRIAQEADNLRTIGSAGPRMYRALARKYDLSERHIRRIVDHGEKAA